MTDSLTKAVRTTLRYDGVGNLMTLREAAGLSGHAFSALRRGQRRISASAARRLARVFATWARECSARADRITEALRHRQPLVRDDEPGLTSTEG